MNWRVVVDALVHKKLNHIPKRYAERLIVAIDKLAIDPYIGDIEKLEGERNVWRRRFGPYRVFYEIDERQRIIHVFLVKRRSSNTY